MGKATIPDTDADPMAILKYIHESAKKPRRSSLYEYTDENLIRERESKFSALDRVYQRNTVVSTELHARRLKDKLVSEPFYTLHTTNNEHATTLPAHFGTTIKGNKWVLTQPVIEQRKH